MRIHFKRNESILAKRILGHHEEQSRDEPAGWGTAGGRRGPLIPPGALATRAQGT